MNNESVKERLLDAGYEGVVYFTNPSYDDALVGVTDDNRAVYDYEKMVFWLQQNEECSDEEARDWIEYNAIRSLPYAGELSPIVMHPL